MLFASGFRKRPSYSHKPHLLPHVDYTSNTISLLHCLKSSIDLWKRLPVGDELVDLELALHVIINQVRELGATLDSAKGTALETVSSACFPVTKKENLPSKHVQ